MTNTTHTISIISLNTPGVLYRIAGMFVRRKINVDYLEVKALEKNLKAKFTIKISAEKKNLQVICKQMEKIYEVEEVQLI